MPHLTTPEAEKMLDKTYRVLNHGHIRLVDYAGGDSRVVVAARQSTTGATKTPQEDRKFIHFLMREGHHTPFEMVSCTFEVKLPIFVARQWIRHRIGSFNEFSGRYSEMKDDFYVPDMARIRKQDRKNKQGSSGEELTEDQKMDFLTDVREWQFSAHDRYKKALETGVAKELARVGLPVSTYTQWYWNVNLRSLFNFLMLRLDSHAQWEIRQYAKVVEKMARAVAPWSYEAFEEYILRAVRLGAGETETLRGLLEGVEVDLEKDPAGAALLDKIRGGAA